MKCPKCQFENREGAKFCKECGNKLELTCSSCGHSVHPGSKFCDECGHDLIKPKEAPAIDYSQPRRATPRSTWRTRYWLPGPTCPTYSTPQGTARARTRNLLKAARNSLRWRAHYGNCLSDTKDSLSQASIASKGKRNNG
jgi:hypothetical protein